MNPRDDEDPPFDDFDDTDSDPVVRELKTEMVRLQAQIDQLAAAARERAAEIADLRVRLTELELRFEVIKARHRKDLKVWAWAMAMYGTAMGLGLSYLLRP
jgi:predicted RNase H-like nuclease (RuvC/YqgF family)